MNKIVLPIASLAFALVLVSVTLIWGIYGIIGVFLFLLIVAFIFRK